ncbi:hypothetical protein [Burkholderia gladioli]|uniref:hypothetical protein n=1 Tax=Burkholderia gladioli TaxID=28095 RepID=UPI0016400F90|nr:hypothetical protein [Burkholderia gladioli]
MKIVRISKTAVIAVMFLTGCAQYQQRQAYDAKMSATSAWLTQQKDAVNSGAKLRSVVFSEYYDKVSAAPTGPLDIPIERYASHMAKVAREYEAGAITKDQYDDENRDQITTMNESIQELGQRAADADERRRQAAAAIFLQTRPRTTNCVGGVGYASCTSY